METSHTGQIERLHRTLLRVATLFGVMAVALMAFSEEHNLFGLLASWFGG